VSKWKSSTHFPENVDNRADYALVTNRHSKRRNGKPSRKTRLASLIAQRTSTKRGPGRGTADRPRSSRDGPARGRQRGVVASAAAPRRSFGRGQRQASVTASYSVRFAIRWSGTICPCAGFATTSSTNKKCPDCGNSRGALVRGPTRRGTRADQSASSG
jgi:hypothetical protein